MCVSCEHHRIVIFRKIVLYFSLSFLPTLLVEPVSKLASLPKWTSFRVRFSAVSYSVTQKTSTHFMSRERKWIEVCLGLKFLQLTPEEKNENVLKCGCTSSTLRDLDKMRMYKLNSSRFGHLRVRSEETLSVSWGIWSKFNFFRFVPSLGPKPPWLCPWLSIIIMWML